MDAKFGPGPKFRGGKQARFRLDEVPRNGVCLRGICREVMMIALYPPIRSKVKASQPAWASWLFALVSRKWRDGEIKLHAGDG
jgi:hypothetical protein